eukprot:1184230-Prorocentrum_minimum.AAC.1
MFMNGRAFRRTLGTWRVICRLGPRRATICCGVCRSDVRTLKPLFHCPCHGAGVVDRAGSVIPTASGAHRSGDGQGPGRGVPRLHAAPHAEVAIIGSGVQEVMGCAIAISVVSDGVVPLWMGALLTASDSFMFLLLEMVIYTHVKHAVASIAERVGWAA